MVKKTSSFAFGMRPAVEGGAFRKFFAELSTSMLVGMTLLALVVFTWIGLTIGKQILNQQTAVYKAQVEQIATDSQLKNKEDKLIALDRQTRLTHQVFSRQVLFSRLITLLEQNTHRQVRWTLLSVRAKADNTPGVTDPNEKKLYEALAARGPLLRSDLEKDKDVVSMTPELFATAYQGLLDTSHIQELPSGQAVALTAPSTLNLSGIAASYSALAEQIVALRSQWQFIQNVVARQVTLSEATSGVNFTLTVELNPSVFSRSAKFIGGSIGQ